MADTIEEKDDRLYKQLITTAFSVYGIPYLCLAIFLVDLTLLGHKTDMVFLAMFLVSLLPCSAIGLRFTTRAEDQKQTNNVKREIAWGAGILIGVLGCLIGLLTLGLLFVITG